MGISGIGTCHLVAALLAVGTALAQAPIGDLVEIDLGPLRRGNADELMAAFAARGGTGAFAPAGAVTVLRDNGIHPLEYVDEHGTHHYFTGKKLRVLTCDVYLYGPEGAGRVDAPIRGLFLVQWAKDAARRTPLNPWLDFDAFYRHWTRHGARGLSSAAGPRPVEVPAVAAGAGPGRGLLGMDG